MWFYFIIFYFISLPFTVEVSSICGAFGFMTQDSISQRSPLLGQY